MCVWLRNTCVAMSQDLYKLTPIVASAVASTLVFRGFLGGEGGVWFCFVFVCFFFAGITQA